MGMSLHREGSILRSNWMEPFALDDGLQSFPNHG